MLAFDGGRGACRAAPASQKRPGRLTKAFPWLGQRQPGAVAERRETPAQAGGRDDVADMIQSARAVGGLDQGALPCRASTPDPAKRGAQIVEPVFRAR